MIADEHDLLRAQLALTALVLASVKITVSQGVQQLSTALEQLFFSLRKMFRTSKEPMQNIELGMEPDVGDQCLVCKRSLVRPKFVKIQQ